ncbi:uncharacterized protein LOC129590767 [Paramacrobiotus metropolitanus]|uniref:uncharacterized protein LOC129590767 n=1 Tax=Paramacrobiotus metropolitanus TaxID=2943436 RepID=UPI002445717A|nr:uncharacterized protein LOC129590767 [Paramacrobiotus metropolitanus]
MHLLYLVALFTFSCMVNGLEYVIFGSRSIRSNSTFPVSILVINATSNVSIEMSLTVPGNLSASPLTFTTAAVLQPDKLTHPEIHVGDLSPAITENFTLHINGSDSSEFFHAMYAPPVQIKSDTTARIEKAARAPPATNRTLLQTDQPTYTANRTVRFRVVTVQLVNYQLWPVFIPVNVQIVDPQGNVVKQYNISSSTEVIGYFAGEIQLTSDPLLGTWTIRVINASREYPVPETTTGISPTWEYPCLFGCNWDVDGVHEPDPVLTSTTFVVQEPTQSHKAADESGHSNKTLPNVVPPFHVNITTPRKYFTLSLDNEIPFNVAVNYASGRREPVKGVFDIAALRPSESQSSLSDETQYLSVWNISIPANNDGEASGLVPLQQLSSGASWLSTAIIRANFTEAATGTTESAVRAAVYFTPERYRVHFGDEPLESIITEKPYTFTPGFPYRISVRILDYDGRPPPLSTTKAEVVAHYFKYNGAGQWSPLSFQGDVRCAGLVTPPMFVGGTASDFNPMDFTFWVLSVHRDCDPPTTWLANVASDGTISLDIPTPRNADFLVVRVSYMNQTPRLYPSFHMAFGKQSRSGSFLVISQVTTELRTGKEAVFFIDTTDRSMEPVHILVLSSSDPSFLWTASILNPGPRVTVSVPMMEQMGSTGRLFAYYVRSDGDLVGDIMQLTVENDQKPSKVTVSVATKSGLQYAQPGEEITVQAHASPFSTVAFLAVDENTLRKNPGTNITAEVVKLTRKPGKPNPQFLLSVLDRFMRPLDTGPVRQFF